MICLVIPHSYLEALLLPIWSYLRANFEEKLPRWGMNKGWWLTVRQGACSTPLLHLGAGSREGTCLRGENWYQAGVEKQPTLREKVRGQLCESFRCVEEDEARGQGRRSVPGRSLQSATSAVSGAPRADAALKAVYSRIGKELQTAIANRAAHALWEGSNCRLSSWEVITAESSEVKELFFKSREIRSHFILRGEK